MNPRDVLQTALLLGAFVTCAGCYGVLYGLGQLRRNQAFVLAAFGAYLVQWVITDLLCAEPGLAFGWKVLVTVSCAAYCAIPPVTWRYLEQVHRREGHQS